MFSQSNVDVPEPQSPPIGNVNLSSSSGDEEDDNDVQLELAGNIPDFNFDKDESGLQVPIPEKPVMYFEHFRIKIQLIVL